MKLTKKILEELIKEELNELTGTQTSTGGEQGGEESEEYQKMMKAKVDRDTAQNVFHQAQDTLHTHKASDKPPEQTNQPDTSKWTHPYSGVTSAVGGGGQPSKGWQYRQATTSDVPDTSKWHHVQQNQTYNVSSVAKPDKTWGYRQSTTQNVPDKSVYIHPYSKIKTPTKGGLAPYEGGWAYDTQVQDKSKFTHPLSKQVVTNDPLLVFKPTHAWKNTPTNIKQLELGKDPKGTTYHQGTQKQYTKASAPLGFKKSEAAKISYPFGPKIPTYGQGAEISKLPKDMTTYDYVRKQSEMPRLPGSELPKGSWETMHPKLIGVTQRHSNLTPFKRGEYGTKQQTSYAQKYGYGTAQDLSTAQGGSGRDQWATGEPTTPTTQQTDYAQVYSQGDTSDYSSEQSQAGRDQWQAPQPTTNPLSMQTNPEWTEYNTQLSSYEDAARDKESAFQVAKQQYRDARDSYEKSMKAPEAGEGGAPPPVPTGGGGASAFGRGKSAGKGRGKGRGRKGRGRGRSRGSWRGKGKGRSSRGFKAKGWGKGKGSTFKGKKTTKGKGKKKGREDESIFMNKNRIITEIMKEFDYEARLPHKKPKIEQDKAKVGMVVPYGEYVNKVNEVNFDKINLPSAVGKWLDRFVDSMKSANLTRIKRAAILYKVIDASGMSVQQLMADIQKIKKELK